MIYDVHVYDAFATDFENEGLVGSLTPISCVHDGIANNTGVLTLTHPRDRAGKWMSLMRGNIIKAWTRVRTTPEIEDGKLVTTVEKWTVKETSSKAERAVYNKKEDGKKLGKVKKGAQVIVVRKPSDSERYKIKSEELTGWIDKDALEYVAEEILPPDDPTAIEDIYPAWGMKRQLFRIYDETRTLTDITVKARPIIYDLAGNMTVFKNEEAVSLQHAATRTLERCVIAHDFTAQTDIADERTGVNWRLQNPIYAFFDPEEGMAAKWGCQGVIDNYEITFLKQAGKNRGMSVEYGRNLTGVSCQILDEEVVTTVLPTGVDENGKTLYLTDDKDELNPGNWITADNAGDYPNPHVYHLECDNCTVGDELGVDKARARMREQAQELLESGVTLPTVNIQVQFINLGSTAEYAAWRDLEKLDLYDKVRVRVPRIGLDALLDVVRVQTDCVTGRTISAEIGALRDVEVSIASYQLGSFSGGKIIPGTIGTPQLGDGIIYTDQLVAGSITAEKIAAGAIETKLLTAETILAALLKAGKVEADMIEAGAITADKIAAGAIDADRIAAGAIDATKIVSGTITAEQLKAGLITADSGLIAVGAIQTAQIADGSITSAKIVSLNADVIESGTLKTDRLLLVGEGGVVYEINAASSGLSQTELSKEQYKNYLNGTVIVANSITAKQIAAGAITANEIAANAITAAKINVADLFAAEATINAINAMDITGNTYLRLYVEDVEAGLSSQIDQTAADIRLEVSKQAGGRNLLLDSARGAGGTGYPLTTYRLSDVPDVGETLTVTIWDAYGETKTQWGIYHGGGATSLATLTAADHKGDGKYSKSFTFRATEGVTGQINVYGMPNDGAYCRIGKIKIERGSRSTEWTPSPLDPASEVIAGSAVTINEEQVRIETPEFLVRTEAAKFQIPGSVGGEDTVAIDKTGMNVNSLQVQEDFYAPNIRQTHPGGVFTSVGAAAAALNNKHLTGDVWVSVNEYVYTRDTLKGITGPGKILISPRNMLNYISRHAEYLNGVTMTRVDSDNSITVTTNGGTWTSARLSVGQIGAMGLRGKTLRFSCFAGSVDASLPAQCIVAAYAGGTHLATMDRPAVDPVTSHEIIQQTFTIPPNIGPWEYLYLYYYAAGDQTITAGASAIYTNNQLRIDTGETINATEIAGRDPYANLLIEECTAPIHLHSVRFTDRLTAYYSNVSVHKCQFLGSNGLIMWGGSGNMCDCQGVSAISTAASAKGGAAISIRGTVPPGNIEGVVDTESMGSASSIGTSVTVPTVTAYKATLTGTSGISDNAVRQGYTTGGGRLKGYIRFGGYTATSGITKAVLRLRRVEGYGKGGNVTVKIYGTDATGPSSGASVLGSPQTLVIGPGEVKEVGVSELAKSYKAFVLYADDTSVMDGKTYSTNFARFTGTGGGDDTIPTLTVTYTT